MSRHSPGHYARTARQFRKSRYLFVKELLPAEILRYLKIYYDILLENGLFTRDDQCPASLSLGGDPGLDAVLEWIRPEVGRLVGLELAPAYSYTRRYGKGELLARHKDRQSCEVSVTLSIEVPKGGAPSVIYLKSPNSRATKIAMREGDGCIYAGGEIEHWRDRFKRDGYIQLFLHFISKSGPYYPEHLFDGRQCLGTGRAVSQKKA
ncbi:MAG TPA: hypothetical protein VH170_02590 [Chthoniobacterales bacterium]|jgi:hypothetical protein|nr:hypothetical protein [Chthoniobacterales bacterium]